LENIKYKLKSNKKSKKISIRINVDGEVVVTKPVRVSIGFVRGVVERKMDWIKEKIEEMKKKPKKLLAHFSNADFHANKIKAHEFVCERIDHYNKFYKQRIEKITIKNQKSRWGSCSGKKNLNFNYKLVFLPIEIADYVIVHEICHLIEMNHSQKFWNQVELQIPDYKTLRKELKKL
jgi:predicted metal-dependent hydrolase